MAKRLVKAGANGLVLFNRFYQPDFDLDEMKAEASATSPSCYQGDTTMLILQNNAAHVQTLENADKGRPLIQAALAGGGEDNVSAIVARVSKA